MAQRQDRINSWQDVYKEINRIINLPATGAATAFDGANVLPIEDVQVGNTIDDTDVQHLIERYEVLKNDALYGSSSQLNTSHVSSTVNLYNTILNPVTDRSIIEASTDTNAQSIKYNMSRIQCRNVVYCTNSYYAACSKREYYYTYHPSYSCSYDCYNDCSCNSAYTCSSRCGNNTVCGYNYACRQCGPNCPTNCYEQYCTGLSTPCVTDSCGACSGHCSPVCRTRCQPRSMYSEWCGADCNGRYYYINCSDTYTCGGRCASASCSGRCGSAQDDSYYVQHCTDCLSQIIEYPCSRGTHNDILCSNTYWAGN